MSKARWSDVPSGLIFINLLFSYICVQEKKKITICTYKLFYFLFYYKHLLELEELFFFLNICALYFCSCNRTKLSFDFRTPKTHSENPATLRTCNVFLSATYIQLLSVTIKTVIMQAMLGVWFFLFCEMLHVCSPHYCISLPV